MWKRMAGVLLCALLVFQMTVVPARADEPVYFLAAGNEVQPVTDQTMPFWSGGYLYIPATVFTGSVRRALGVTCVRVGANDAAILQRNDGSDYLLFEMSQNYAKDMSGKLNYPGGILRNGTIFVPAFLVAKYFGLEYSVTEIEQGQLVWIRQQNFGLSDKQFADAAAYPVASKYEEYLKTKVESVPAEVPETGTEIDGKRIYLCLTADESAEIMLNALARYAVQATFFCDLDFLEQQGDLLRRMTVTGQSIGLLVDADHPTLSLQQQLETGNQALERATCGRTRLARIQNGTDQAIREVQEAGYRALEPDVDYSGYYLQNSTHADALLKRVSARSGNVAVWLGDHANGAGLRAFLGAAKDADGRCLAWTETA